jgi:hypothetical protein
MFSEPPAFTDADVFAQGVERRLERSWTLRRLAIGVAGVAGGSVAVSQALGAHLIDRISVLSSASVLAVSHGARAFSQLRLLSDLPVGGEVMWVGAGLALLGVVLMATRSLENL